MDLFLPTGKPELKEALQHHYSLGLRELYQKSRVWTQVHWYLLGMRNFRGMWSSGLSSFEDISGQRTVRWERALSAIQTDIGRVMSLDVRPAVVRPPGITIGGIRDTAIAQASLDYLVSDWNLDRLKMSLGYYLSAFGTGGLGVWGPGTPGVSDHVHIDTIPPWELMPLPGAASSGEATGGLIRRRWVDADWLREAMRDRLPRFPSIEKLDPRQVAPGAYVTLRGDPTKGMREAPIPEIAEEQAKREEASRKKGKYVLLKEFFIDGPEADSCRRWITMGGPEILDDLDYTSSDGTRGELPVRPVHPARYLSLGSFYGRGLADRLIYYNREIEVVIANLLQNLADLDWFGITYVPADMGINLADFKKSRKNRFGTYYRDVGGSNDQPLRLGPNNVGTLGAPALQILTELMGAITNQGDLYAGKVPGRLESARALGVYLETQNIPMAPVIESVSSAFIGVYKALLGIAKTVIPQEFPLKMLRLDSAILGLRVDPASGQVKVAPDELPGPYAVEISVRNKAPENQQQKLNLLQDHLRMGVISPLMYRILLMKEGLAGETLLDRAEYESYRKAWWENIILFGDGKASSTEAEGLDGSEVGDIHPIHKFVHKEVMASIAWQRADESIRELFLEHYAQHETYSGLPEMIPSVTELAGLADGLPPELMGALGEAGAGGPAGPSPPTGGPSPSPISPMAGVPGMVPG